ncbi:GNAT family N-acetyltransferase [Streptomyces sp. NPDC058548]|uniref:GNAT family N-acetyltransferase n=1 Tax=Streptomyces sp. NPDC058548 TaxID=3346545 RepID=UPI00364F13D2
MDPSLYRIRPIQAVDIDAAVELTAQANPFMDAQALSANRHLLELATGEAPTEEALRTMAQELAQLSGGLVPRHEIYRQLKQRVEAGEDVTGGAMVTLVAEETATGQVVGLVSAGPPGKWSHRALTELPPPMNHHLRDRIAEISDIAVASSARRQGVGTGLLSALLNSTDERAKSWRVALWFFHEDLGFGDFHRSMAPEWPVGKPLAFVDSSRRVAPFRELTGDLRACVAPLHPDLKLIMDPSGVPAIGGVFDHAWPGAQVPPPPRGTPKPSKRDRKADKKARGRARG